MKLSKFTLHSSKSLLKLGNRFNSLLYLLFFFVGNSVYSQITTTLTPVQPECNNDGILQVQVIGITPPYDIYLYHDAAFPATLVSTHAGVSSNIDQFTGLQSSNYQAVILQGGIPIDTTNFLWLTSFIQVMNPNISMTYTCPAINATFTLNIIGGQAPYTISWYNGLNTITTGNPCQLPQGQYYSYQLSDINGCVYRHPFNGAGNAASISYYSGIFDTVITTVANCTNGTASVTNLSGGTPPYTYQWSNGATTSSISNLSMGSNWVKVTDSQGCYRYDNFQIQQVPTMSVGVTSTNATCLQQNGSATAFAAGGQPPYTYQWSGGQTTQTITNLPAGTFIQHVVAHDANGCIGIDNAGGITITSTSPVTATYTSSVSQCTLATGSVSLSVSGNTGAYNVTWNTIPPQTGTTLSNVLPGEYSFHIVDNVGCDFSGSVSVLGVSVLLGYVSNTPENCNAGNGSAQFSFVQYGLAPYSYHWTNGATTQTITGLQSGSYGCTVTDALGCSVTKTTIVQKSSPINIGFTTTPASCKYISDGMVQANISGGIAPYTYIWSTGATGPILSNVLWGGHFLTVIDASGCVETAYVYVGYNAANTSCYCLINGVVYDDLNSNCVLDAGENGLNNIMVECSGVNGNQYVYTDTQGYYSFSVPSGTYQVTEILPSNISIGSCQQITQQVTSVPTSNCIIPTNFANILTPVHDLHILLAAANPPIPGNLYNQQIIITNDGNYTENNAQFNYTTDGQLGSFTSNLSFAQLNAGLNPNWYNTNIPSLSPSASFPISVSYNVPTNIPMGTIVNFKDTVAQSSPVGTSWLADYSPWNNVKDYNATIVSSFDPNFKEVTPKGTGPYGIISYNDTILEYVIHFQNTGTYMAQKVVISDTLDSNLRWNTLIPGYSDHSYTAAIDQNGVLSFTFNNIDLLTFGELSKGMVSYRIKTKKNLPPGTEFRNSAAIYFDYNAPILTNTTLNTIVHNLSTSQIEEKKEDFILFPNPSNGVFTVSTKSNFGGKGELSILNTQGKIVHHELLSLTAGDKEFSVSTNSLPNGIYFVRLVMGNSTETMRLVIMK